MPHISIERSGGDVAEDADRFVAIALPQDASLPLLDVPGPPRRIELRERGQPFLDVRARAHLFGAAEQDANAAGIDGIEEQLLFGIGIGFVNEGDFGIGDTETDEVLAHFVVDVPALRIGRGEIAEDQLRAAFGGGFLPDGKDAAGGALEFGIVLGVFAESHQAQVESRFSAIAGDLEHVVDAGIDLLCLEGLGAFDQGLDVLLERVARRGCFDDRLAGFEFRPRQLQHVGGLDIGHGAEHGQQFRHIDEAGEAGVHAVAAAIGREFQGGDGFGEAGGPGIEVPGAGAFEQRRGQIAQHGVHFGEGVADGRAGGKDHAAGVRALLNVADLQIHIEGAEGVGIRQAGDARHFGDVRQVLEGIGLIDHQLRNTEVLKRHCVVFHLAVRALFKADFQALFGRFELLDDAAVVAVAGVHACQLVVDFTEFFVEEPFEEVVRERQNIRSCGRRR